MRSTRLLLLASLICALAGAQQASLPRVTFTQDFPGSEPEHFVITASSDCGAQYDSASKRDAESGVDPFHIDFTLSQPTCGHIFELTKRAGYFSGELDSKKKNLASTGRKTLIYENSQQTTRGTYNYSLRPEVEELTRLFQGLSTTFEFGHRLEYDYRYQKLALGEELSRMEDMAKRNDLVELLALTPILKHIAGDTSVINAVRARAQRLLAVPSENGGR